MYCTECGAILPDNVKFCSSCGSMISTSEEATTPENEQIQADVRELREDLATIQDSNDGTRKTILIGLAFFCLFLIFKPGPLGISMSDWASSECFWSDTGPPYYEDGSWDCEVRDENRLQVAILGIISLACFFAALKKPESEEDEPEEKEPESEEDEPEEKEPEKEATVLNPLEKKREVLERNKLVKLWTLPVVLLVCIYCISLIITPTDTGLQEYREGEWEWGTTSPDLMLNTIDALDVNNCINQSSAWYSGLQVQAQQQRCQDLVDLANQKIRSLIAIMFIANITGYFVLKNSKEQISEIQDSITEMEEE